MDKLAALRQSPLFRDLDRRALRDMAQAAEWVELRGGAYLFRSGQKSDAFYVMVNGRVRVHRAETEDGKRRLLIEVAQGETVGEIAVLTGEDRAADAMALRDSDLLRIGAPDFERLVRRHPGAMLRIARLIVTRLRYARRTEARDLLRNSRTYAVVPAGAGVDVRGFTERFCDKLAHGGSVLRLDSSRVEQALGENAAELAGEPGQASRALSLWLNRLEDSYRYLVYQARGEPDAWTRRSLRQADRVVLLCNPGESVDDSAVMQWLKTEQLSAPIERVLIGAAPDTLPDDGPPRPSGDRFAGTHQLRPDRQEADMARLARLVSGRGLCLVLGGGGARGFAHVGLLRALEEKGIPVDAIGGTSMGALVAALVAVGKSADEVLQVLRETFVDHNYLNDYSISRIALINGRKFRKRMIEVFGDVRIEDLPIRYFSVSASLSTGQPVIHGDGRLVDWVCTSMAVPGIAPPMVRGNELLVDGGLSYDAPFEAMMATGRGRVIYSDVSRAKELVLDGEPLTEPTNLVDVPEVPKTLNMFKILFHTAAATGAPGRNRVRERADLLLQMPVADVAMFDWEKLDDIVYRAYHHADEQLDLLLAEHPDMQVPDEARTSPPEDG